MIEGLAESLGGTGLAPQHVAHHMGRFERTFESMKPWLPAQVENFLDIGCGLGGVAIHVARHYPGAVAHLIDGAGEIGKWTSYREDGKPWADVRVAVRLFRKHCPAAEVLAHPPLDSAVVPPCELVYSNCSWGHHYPIDTYLGLAGRVLKPGGRLIVDLRLGRVGEYGAAQLEAHGFTLVWTIAAEGKKYARTVWERE